MIRYFFLQISRIFLLGVLLFPDVAIAQNTNCFRMVGQSKTSARRVQHVVDISSTIRLNERCEYSQNSEGPWYSAGQLAGRNTDFLELLHHLSGAHQDSEQDSEQQAESSADPRFIFAQPVSTQATKRRTTTPVLHTLILRYCAHYLLEEQLGFRVVPLGSESGFRVQRIPGSDSGCNSQNVEIRAVRGTEHGNLYHGSVPGDQRLNIGAQSLRLPQGEWTLFAARRSGSVGLRIGVFRATGVVTPLQNHLRSVGTEPSPPEPGEPLLSAQFRSDVGGLLLFPNQRALGQELLWPELRTAADAGLIWLASQNRPEMPPIVVDVVRLEQSPTEAIRFADMPVYEHMRENYGEAGESMAPTLGDWQRIFSELTLCLTPNYFTQQHANVSTPVPQGSSCGLLSGLAVFESEPSSGASSEDSTPRMCLHRGMHIIGSEGTRRVEDEQPMCIAFPEGNGPMPFHVATKGDRLTIENAENTCVMIDNSPVEPSEEGFILDRSGLLEVRRGGGPECLSQQALTLIRLPVIDPEREWHPVGFHTSDEPGMCVDEEGNEDGHCPWRALDHDEDEVFPYVRSRHSLEFRLSTSPSVAAAINREPDGQVLLSQDIPLLSGIVGDFEGARWPGIVAVVSRDDECPNDRSARELRAERPVQPNGQSVDRNFHVYLASIEGADEPVQCLSRATFRVRESRSVANATAGRVLSVNLGFIGDIRFVFFPIKPLAMGISMPFMYVRLDLFPVRYHRFLAIEIAGNLVFAGAVDPAAISRTGVSFSAAVEVGVPKYVPRLLSAGIMIHGAFQSHPEDNPIVSFYLGLDLSALIDLAGGR